LTWELPQWNSPPYGVGKDVGLLDGLSLLVGFKKGVIGLFVTAG